MDISYTKHAVIYHNTAELHKYKYSMQM